MAIELCTRYSLYKLPCIKNEACSYSFRPCPIHDYSSIDTAMELGIECVVADIHVGDVIRYTYHGIDYIVRIVPTKIRNLLLLGVKKEYLCPVCFNIK